MKSARVGAPLTTAQASRTRPQCLLFWQNSGASAILRVPKIYYPKFPEFFANITHLQIDIHILKGLPPEFLPLRKYFRTRVIRRKFSRFVKHFRGQSNILMQLRMLMLHNYLFGSSGIYVLDVFNLSLASLRTVTTHKVNKIILDPSIQILLSRYYLFTAS